MDMTEVLRRVKSRFGDPNSVFIDNTDIVDWANEAIREIVRATKCYITTTNTDQGYVTFDTDQISIESVFITSTRRYLRPTSFEDIVAKGLDVSYVDEPQFYYVREWSTGRVVHTWPVPATGTFITFNIAEFPPLVDDNDTIVIPVSYHNDIVNFCVARAHEKNQNYQAFRLMMDEFTSKVSDRYDEWDRQEQESFTVIRDDPFDSDVYGVV